MIVRPEAMDFTQQHFSAIIYGAPGVGKTTLALSAPKPLLIDFDGGVSRVKAAHRCPTIMPADYEEVNKDIHNVAEMKEFETIVLDTGGAFVTYLKDWAMRTKTDAKMKNGQFNALKGFGYVKSEFAAFTDYIKNVLHKNVIYVFHSVEQADRDGNSQQRLMCEGAARNTVWNGVDFGGYVQMIGTKRVICFTPEEEYFAKGTHGIEGRVDIPTIGAMDKNDFMTGLFERARASIVAEKDENDAIRAAYDLAMSSAREMVDAVTDIDTANDALTAISTLTHALTSKQETWALLNTKCKSIGLKFDVSRKQFIAAELKTAEAQ